MRLRPISSQRCFIVGRSKVFDIMYARFSFVLTSRRTSWLLSTAAVTKWYLRSICYVLAEAFLFRASDSAAVLSINIDVSSNLISLSGQGTFLIISHISLRIQVVCFALSNKATYSDSADEVETIVCFLIGTPLMATIHPDVYFLVSWHPPQSPSTCAFKDCRDNCYEQGYLGP